MQAAFAVGQADHDEADVENHPRQELGKEPSRSTAKPNPVPKLVCDLELEHPLAYRSLPGRTSQQGFIQPLSNKCQNHVDKDRAQNCENHLGGGLLVLLSSIRHSNYYRQDQNKKERSSYDPQDDMVNQVGQKPEPKSAIAGSGDGCIGYRRCGSVRLRGHRRWRRSEAYGKASATFLARLSCRKILRSALGAKDKIFLHSGDYNAICISAANRNRCWNRFSIVFQGQFQSTEVGMRVDAHGKGNVQIVSGLKHLRLEPLCHPPADSFIVKAGFGVGQALVHTQLDVLVFKDSWRQQQVHAVAAKHRLGIALAKRLQPAQIPQQIRSYRTERNLCFDGYLRQQIIGRKAGLSVIIQPLLQERNSLAGQGKTNPVS